MFLFLLSFVALVGMMPCVLAVVKFRLQKGVWYVWCDSVPKLKEHPTSSR